MKTNQQRIVRLVPITLLLTIVGHCQAELLIESDFDDLPIGSAPDNQADAGPWQLAYPSSFAVEDRETHPNMLSIVPSDSFDLGATGNALRVEQSKNGTSATAHYFDEPVFEEDVDIVRASFDVYIPAVENAGRSGPAVMLGGSNESFLAHTRRGPHVKWDQQGRFVGTTNYSASGEQTLVSKTPQDEWQRVRLDIDLNDNSYDVFWGTDGNALELVKSYVQFQIQGHLDYLDRIEVVSFSSRATGGVSFIDNVRVESLVRFPGDANLDGEFNSGDLVDVFSENLYETDKTAAWSQGDWNGDRRFTSSDLIAAFQDGGYEKGPRAAAVPEPNGVVIAVALGIGLLGLRRGRPHSRYDAPYGPRRNAT